MALVHHLRHDKLDEMDELQAYGLVHLHNLQLRHGIYEKELDEKNRNRIENLKDMVLYRFGSTGVVQVLSKAADLLGLTPVFPVRNTTTFGSGANDSKFVFRDCVLVKRGSTVADVGKKIMGDAPIAYIEGVGGIRVAEDQLVGVGKNDVSCRPCCRKLTRTDFCNHRSFRSRLDALNSIEL